MIERVELAQVLSWTGLLLLLAACAGTPEPRSQGFRLALDWGPAEGPRTEVELAGPDHGPLGVRIRRASEAGRWPLVPDACFGATLDAAATRRLVTAVEDSRYFGLPTVLEDPDRGRGPWLGLSVQHGLHSHTLRARGRRDPALLAVLEALDRCLPLRLDPWPVWLGPMLGGDPGRPALVADPERALALVDAWLVESPGDRALGLDRFALLLELDRRDEAEAWLDELSADPALRGLEQELRRRLRR